jgi:hypothetical protein
MDKFIMSKKELKQVVVFSELEIGKITQIEAARRLNITERWVREKYKRYRKLGEKGLIHRNRGNPSTKRWDAKERNFMVSLIENEWAGFGPTFAAEKLWEMYSIKVCKEVVRQTMIAEGLWRPKERKRKHRKRRERRPMLGLFTQLDGSPHDWFEGRGPICTLLVFIDDATSKILWLEFAQSESYFGIMQATKNYVEHYGIPHEFYVDHGSVFRVNLNNPEHIKRTQWERAVGTLGIKVSHAHSPQAKGRVERCNGTMQDRLVKEMRLAQVSSIEEANQFLRKTDFIAQHNQRFAVPAHQEGDAHMPVLNRDLGDVFCLKEERILMNDYTISFDTRIFQLTKTLSVRPKDRITVNVHLDNSITLTIRKVNLEYTEIACRPDKKQPAKEKMQAHRPCKPNENSKRWVNGLPAVYSSNSANRRVG